jgi:enamine deaminase RidA (YjgF/YER057c/UK114 family)
MEDSCETRFAAVAAALGYNFDGEIKIGGNYVAVVQHGNQVYVSGKIPRSIRSRLHASKARSLMARLRCCMQF